MITPHPPKRKRKSKNLFSLCQLFQVIGSINVISVILKIVRRDRQKKKKRRGEAYRELVFGQQCGIYPVFFYAFLVVTKKRIQTNKTSMNLIKA